MVLALSAPRGKAIYARGDLLDPDALVNYLRALGCKWVALQPAHVRRGAPAALKRARIPWWLFSTPGGDGDPGTPDSWTPSQFARTIPAFEELVAAHGGRGYIADVETGWGAATDAQVAQLARMLIDSAKQGLDVGVTTFPAHRIDERLGALGVGKYAWLSLQLYSERSPAETKRILDEAERAGWSVQVPSVAAYRHVVVEGPDNNYARPRTPEEWNRAYAAWPRVRGAVIWYVTPRPNAGLLATIAAWRKWVPLVVGCCCGGGSGPDGADGVGVDGDGT